MRTLLRTVLLAVTLAMPTGAAPAGTLDCFEQLSSGESEEIGCEFPARMTAAERKEVERLTRGLFKDASCTVEVRIERRLVDEAMAASGDHVFESPPLATHCEVVTAKKTFPIELTFAPRVVFKGGAAVEASPRMDNVTGVPTALWWPVAYWLNTADTIEEPMLRIVNAYKRNVAQRQATAE